MQHDNHHRTYPRYRIFFMLSLALALALAACQPNLNIESEPVVADPVVVDPADPDDAGDDVEAGEALTPATGDFGIPSLESGMMLALTLLHRDIYSRSGEPMGEVEDLLIDATTGNVLFAEVEHGGFLEIGDEEVMVPFTAMQWGNESAGAFTLGIDEETFANWPELGEAWPVAGNTNWDDAITDFWVDAGVTIPWNASEPMDNVVWVSNLLDNGFGFEGGATVVNIKNLVIDVADGQARYALVTAEEGVFGDDEVRAVPFMALNIRAGETDTFTIEPTLGPDVIANAPVVPATAFDGMLLLEDEWDDELASYWADHDYLVDSGEGDLAIGNMGATGVVGADNIMMLASAMLDREVDNVLDAELGEIEDLYIDGASGNVLFATVEHGGFLDIGDEDFPVPLTALTWNATEEELILPITGDLLESFPAIEDDWATTLEPGWRQVSEFWRNSDFDTTIIEEANIEGVLRASELTGYGIAAHDEAGFADVRDLIIDLGNSKVQYAVVAFRDTDAYGTELIIVPYSAFDPGAFGEQSVFAEDFDTTLLNDAPRLGAGVFGTIDTLDPSWDDAIADFWNDAGYTIGAG